MTHFKQVFRYPQFTGALMVGLVMCIALSLFWSPGSQQIVDSDSVSMDIFLNLRLPRVLTAFFAGGAIAVSGLLSQSLFRNALATPSVLGTEAGGSLGLAISVAFSIGLQGNLIQSDLVMVSSFAGALAASVFALVLARRTNSLVKMLLGGFALNALLGALSALITSWLMESGRGAELYHLLLGTFSARNWTHVGLIAAASVACGIVAAQLARPLDLLSLGEDTVSTMGLSVLKLNTTVLVTIAVLVGTSISVGGALPFVGLIVPHFCRMKTGPYFKSLLFNTFCGGALLTLLADFFARNLRYPIEMNVGLITTTIGAPYFIYLVRNKTSYD